MKASLDIIGTKIKDLRTLFGYTQQEISEFLGIGQSLISKYESGERAISVDSLEKLSNLFGCDLVNSDEYNASTCTPPKVAFRANDICSADMDAICTVNRVVQNIVFMTKLLKEI